MAGILAGDTSGSPIRIRVGGDTDIEGDETVIATLSLEQTAIDAGVELGTSTATHTIRDDDTPYLSISAPADADEGDSGTTDRDVEVTLSKPAPALIHFKLCYSGTATLDPSGVGTVAAGTDYKPLGGTPVHGSGRKCRVAGILAGDTSGSPIRIRVGGDTDIEGDETVIATLSLEQTAIDAGVELGTSTATHTIRDDDTPYLSISAPADADEGDSGTTDRATSR